MRAERSCMKRTIAKSLPDALDACIEIESFTTGATRELQLGDRALQLIVERLPLIVGEAIHRAATLDESLISRLPEARDSIGTRNRIVHG